MNNCKEQQYQLLKDIKSDIEQMIICPITKLPIERTGKDLMEEIVEHLDNIEL